MRFSGAALTEGVEEHRIDEVSVRITGVAKTVVDCFKFRNKIGLEVGEMADGIEFQLDSIRADEIRKEANYAGVRVTLIALIDGARVSVQVDIGFGDAVTPSPENIEYPVILAEFNAPKLRAYPRYTVVAEN